MFILQVSCLYVVLNIVAVYSAVANPQVVQDVVNKPATKTEQFDVVSFLGNSNDDQAFVSDLSGTFGKDVDDENNIKRTKRQDEPAPATPTKAEVNQLENENYEVKYKTKFAFQNVDNGTDKLIKYNRTEHVYYGNDYNKATEAPAAAPPAARA